MALHFADFYCWITVPVSKAIGRAFVTARSASEPSDELHRGLFPILAIVIALVANPQLCWSQVNCSTTSYRCNGAAYESHAPSGSCSDPQTSVTWDVAAGSFTCDAHTYGGNASASLSTTAVYTLTGLPLGTPVLMRLRLTLTANVPACPGGGCVGFCDGSDTIYISGPGAVWSAIDFGGNGDPNEIQVVEMLFDGRSGDSFGITFNVAEWLRSSEDFCIATLHGQIDFYDVPAGVIIAVCQTPVSVDDGVGTELALQLLTPNPGHGAVAVTFALPSEAPASLALYDIGGRLIEKRDLAGLGAGQHTVRFGDHAPLAAGVYLIRLVQGPYVASARQIVLQ